MEEGESGGTVHWEGDRITYQCDLQELRYDSRAVGSTEGRMIHFGGLVMISKEMTSETNPLPGAGWRSRERIIEKSRKNLPDRSESHENVEMAYFPGNLEK